MKKLLAIPILAIVFAFILGLAACGGNASLAERNVRAAYPTARIYQLSEFKYIVADSAFGEPRYQSVQCMDISNDNISSVKPLPRIQ